MEEWFSRLPQAAKADLRGRLRSPDDRQFLGAFWELYLHECLWRLGFDVTPHPRISGSTRKPDYLAEGPEGSFYLEATIVTDADGVRAARNGRNRIYDLLDGKVHSPNFFLGIEVEGTGADAPAVKGLIRVLEKWLYSLNPEEVEEALQLGSGGDALPEFLWQVNGWMIRFLALPKSTEFRGREGLRPLGSFDDEPARWLNEGNLTSRLEFKADRYGELDRPYLLAAMWDDPLSDSEDALTALFGRPNARVERTESGGGVSEFVYRGDGFWGSLASPRNRHVSAVLTAHSLRPWSVPRAKPRLALNPWASRPLALELPWDMTVVDSAAVVLETRITAVPPHVLLGLPKRWPGPEAAGVGDWETPVPPVGEDQIRAVVARIAKEFSPEKVILFGSQAYGDPQPDSDVDLLVLLDFDNSSNSSKAVEVLNSVDPSFPVDLLVVRPRDAARRYVEGDPVLREAFDRGVVLHE